MWLQNMLNVKAMYEVINILVYFTFLSLQTFSKNLTTLCLKQLKYFVVKKADNASFSMTLFRTDPSVYMLHYFL